MTAGERAPVNYFASEALQQALDQWQLFAPTPGANVTVYDEAWGYWSGACGYRDLTPLKKMQPDRRFYIYSISKTITAIIVLNRPYETGKYGEIFGR